MAQKAPATSVLRRPMLRWAGSKRKLLPYLLKCVPDFERYVEPFAGSACLFFSLRPSKKAILGDFNPELIRTYRAVRKYPKRIGITVNEMPRTRKFYYQLRETSISKMDSSERAARFIYLNRFCFNGVYRTNKAGDFNVPRGVKTGKIPPPANFLSWASALKNAQLISGDFGNALRHVRSGDFVYLDPPYTKHGSKYSGEYGYGSFSDKDLQRLLKWLVLLHSRGATFLVS